MAVLLVENLFVYGADVAAMPARLGRSRTLLPAGSLSVLDLAVLQRAHVMSDTMLLAQQASLNKTGCFNEELVCSGAVLDAFHEIKRREGGVTVDPGAHIDQRSVVQIFRVYHML